MLFPSGIEKILFRGPIRDTLYDGPGLKSRQVNTGKDTLPSRTTEAGFSGAQNQRHPRAFTKKPRLRSVSLSSKMRNKEVYCSHFLPGDTE